MFKIWFSRQRIGAMHSKLVPFFSIFKFLFLLNFGWKDGIPESVNWEEAINGIYEWRKNCVNSIFVNRIRKEGKEGDLNWLVIDLNEDFDRKELVVWLEENTLFGRKVKAQIFKYEDKYKKRKEEMKEEHMQKISESDFFLKTL